uniref:C-myc n=1 Tax=Plectus sambesii TaxID=2011161 RepID=A0A914VVW8_9BILA
MIRSANQSLMLDEFDDFAPSLNVSDLLNGVGEDHDVFSSLLNDYDPSTAVDYWTALLDKEEEEGAQTDSSSSQASPCSIDSGNHSPSSSSCEALNFADFPVQPAACSATARRQR